MQVMEATIMAIIIATIMTVVKITTDGRKSRGVHMKKCVLFFRYGKNIAGGRDKNAGYITGV